MKSDPNSEPAEVRIACERTAQVQAAGWTAGVATMFLAGALVGMPTWPVATGVSAVAAMVAVVCVVMLRR